MELVVWRREDGGSYEVRMRRKLRRDGHDYLYRERHPYWAEDLLGRIEPN